jgi:hypothetical protein
MARRTSPPRPPAAPPASAEAAAALVAAHMLKVFARTDGEAVDRQMIAETLFLSALDAAAKLPDDARRSLAGRVHEWSYEAMTGDAGASNRGPSGGVAAPSNTALFKSIAPGPPKPGR